MSDVMIGRDGEVVEGLASSYDNIDENGNVIYLDEERRNRKERLDKPVFKNHAHGIGLKDAFWPKFSARPWNFNGYAAAFHVLKSALPWTEHPKTPHGKLMRGALMMDSDRGYSGGTVYNLNVDVEDEGRTGVLPIDLVRQAIDKADFIGGMDKCICRTANKCQEVHGDVACMFLGKGGKTVVEHGIARELTKEEAYARVDRAAEQGIACTALWVQIEQLVWGLRNDQMSDMVEICFCCPCCCTALNLCKTTTPDIRRRFTPSGFTATIDHSKCIGCHKCMDTVCPQDALQVRASDGKVVVNQEACFGCGYCKAACPTGAIKIKQTMPMRESVHEHFLKETRLDLAVDGFPGAGA